MTATTLEDLVGGKTTLKNNQSFSPIVKCHICGTSYKKHSHYKHIKTSRHLTLAMFAKLESEINTYKHQLHA